LQYIGSTAITDPGGADGGVLQLYKPPAGSFNIDGVRIQGINFIGYDVNPTASKYGLEISQVQHSSFIDIGAWGVQKAGIYQKGLGVMNEYYGLHVTGNEKFFPNENVAPADGIVFYGSALVAQITQSAITNAVVEYVTNCGIELEYTHNLTFVGGLVEANGTTDMCIGNVVDVVPATQNLIVDGMDFEVTPNAISDNGQGDEFRNITTQNGGLSTFKGQRAVIKGGLWRSIAVASTASHTSFYGLNYNPNAGSAFVDHGIQTYIDPNNFQYNGNFQNSIYPASSAEHTRLFTSGVASPLINPKANLQGVWDFRSGSGTVIDTSPLSDTAWNLILIGEFYDNTGVHTQNASIIEVSSSNPTYTTVGGTPVTFSITRGKFQGIVSAGTNIAEFVGSMFIIPAGNSTSSSLAWQSTDPSHIGTASKVGGNFIVGASTSGSGSCTTARGKFQNVVSNGVTVKLAVCD